MTNADQVKALVRSHAEGDDTRFYAVALQVAARAARSGQAHFAQELRDLVDERQRAAKRGGSLARRPTPLTQPKGDLADLLSVSYPKARMADLVVNPDLRAELERIVLEQRQRDRLQARGFRPLRRVLLMGPPGTGKTLSASVLAGELHLPLFVIRLDGLITKFMGETAAKLRLVFDAMVETRGVYLFDEVDALAGERTRGNDVGEIRRVLNSFLQFLEQDESDSLLIAATNHPQLLDRAMFRRFDAVVAYALPTPEVARAVIKARLASVQLARIRWKAVDAVADGLSHAEITLAAERAAKDTILAGETSVTTERIVAALEERRKRASR